MFGNLFGSLYDSSSPAPMKAWNTSAAQANPTPAHQNWINAQQSRSLLGQTWYQQASAAQQQNYQQAMTQQQQTAMASSLGRWRREWMVNGVPMTFEEFLDEIAPGEDNSLRTFLILKYKK